MAINPKVLKAMSIAGVGLNAQKTRGDVSTVSLSTNGSNSTATRLTINGGYVPNSVTDSTRLNFSPTEDGQVHAYIWDSTASDWAETMTLGISTVDADDVFMYLTNENITDTTANYYPLIIKSANLTTALKVISGGYGVEASSSSTNAIRGEALASVPAGVYAINSYDGSDIDSGEGLYAQSRHGIGAVCRSINGSAIRVYPRTGVPIRQLVNGSIYYDDTENHSLNLLLNSSWKTFSFDDHTHDDRYYTETEIDTNHYTKTEIDTLLTGGEEW